MPEIELSLRSMSLYEEFYKTSQGFPKQAKYGLAADILNLILKLISEINRANTVRDKEEYMIEAKYLVSEINIRLRLLIQLGILNVKRYANFVKSTGEINQQLKSWFEWFMREERKNAQT